MKQNLLCCLLLLAIFSCKRNDLKQEEEGIDRQAELLAMRSCAAHEVLEEQLAADPQRRQRLEAFNAAARNFDRSQARIVNGVLEIPVVVNVLYRSATENVSDAQINSQIDVLNKDFTNTNADRNKLTSTSFDDGAGMNVRFVLVKTVRKATKKTNWSTNDDMKRSAKGGIDPTSPSNHLNIWVVGKMQAYGMTILGYAQFPGGDPATDGVVIGYNYFGTVGPVRAPFNKGRTATHEVGHWMNLYHIWGDESGCQRDDGVGDTPLQADKNFGCKTFPRLDACTSSGQGVMFFNYMDYTDDACMYMFTSGQVNRMTATFFANGAPRAGFTQ